MLYKGRQHFKPAFAGALLYAGSSDFNEPFKTRTSNLPILEGIEDYINFSYCLKTAVALSITGCVDVHSDEGVVDRASTHSLFWLCKKTGEPFSFFGEDGWVEMERNDFVIFNHMEDHAILTNSYWTGLAVQLSE